MNWEQARRMLRIPRPTARSRAFGPAGSVSIGVDPLAVVRAASICIASGKGGTGKSLVASALATLLARSKRTLLFDADLGVGNAHILQDASPEHSFVDVVEGRMDVSEIVVPCRERLDLLAAGSGYARMAGLSSYELHLIASGLEQLELQYGTVLVDSAAGISSQTVSFAAASDIVLIVTTPDLTAMTDAYAFMKVLLRRRPSCEPLLVINRVTEDQEAEVAAKRLEEVSLKFLNRRPRWIGSLPEDRAAFRSIQRRQPVILSEPDAPLSQALVQLGLTIEEELGRVRPRGLGRSLTKRVGYTPAKQ
jgi:flagellar biosynthesis protein FlhG